MTQMGLDYMKHKETARHNVQDENIRGQTADAQTQDADTRKFVASFKPQEVSISQQQADASSVQAQSSASQADTAAGRLSLDSSYREREMLAKEGMTDAQLSQARTAILNYTLNSEHRERETVAKEITARAAKDQALTQAERNEITKIANAMKNLSPADAATEASKSLGYGASSQVISGINRILSDLIPSFSNLVTKKIN